jgi:DNA-binding LytR/AlgR family response regulator
MPFDVHAVDYLTKPFDRERFAGLLITQRFSWENKA